MPDRSEVAYFGAGPAPLPTPVIEASAKAFVNFENTGLGLAEVSHRSPTANKILADSKAALVNLYDIPEDEYEIIFMQAGGTGEFSAALQNLVGFWVERKRRELVKELGEGKDEEVVERLKQAVKSDLKVDYLVTGSWSLKASQEASRLSGSKYVNVAVDARKANNGKFGMIPPESAWNLSKNPALTYFCDNETVDGVEFPTFPKSLEATSEEDDRIVVADMSSNFMSRKINVRNYSIIFGGAQKNLGIAGVTVVIIRKALLSLTPSATLMHKLSSLLPSAIPPIMFDFPTIAKNNSLYNTLPIFNLYVATLVLQSLVSTFGSKKVSGQEEIANKKAELLYSTLDEYSDTYAVVPDKAVRSRMNVCFRVIKKGSKGSNGLQGSTGPEGLEEKGAGEAEAKSEPEAKPKSQAQSKSEGAKSESQGPEESAGKVEPDEAREKEFLSGAEKRGLLGLKGHRSVGGIRASNYNAVPLANVQKLVAYLEEFART